MSNPITINSAKYSPVALFIAAIFSGVPLLSQAGEVIKFDGSDPSLLRPDPMEPNARNSLFPFSSLSDNTITVTNGLIKNNVYGGFSDSDKTISGNTIFILGGKVGNTICGGIAEKGVATGNSVTVSGGAVHDIFGGISFYGNVTDNRVTITGGTVGGDVYGGASQYDSSSKNRVTISGGKVSRNVFGGMTGKGSSTGNSIRISGDPQFSADFTYLSGGYATEDSHGDIFTDNNLYFAAHPITVKGIKNFDKYYFTLDPTLANKEAALISANHIVLGNGSDRSSTVAVVGIHSGNVLHVNDHFILMKATDKMEGEGVGHTSVDIAQQGISLLYDVRTDVDLTNNQVTATILGADPSDPGAPTRGSGAYVNPQLKSLSEGNLAGAMLITRGADTIAYDAFNMINQQNHNSGLAPFIITGGSHSRYSTGSHITSDDFLLTGGLSYQQENITTALFLESGWGNYDSYNSFRHFASVKGEGHSRYFGTGLLGRYDFDSGFYTDASLRVGRNRTVFDNNDIHNIDTGEHAHYNLKASYFSTHAGVGYLLPLDKQTELDLSTKYLYTTLGGEKVHVADDPIRFKRIDSSRLRGVATLNYSYNKALILSSGLGYEYELDGKAKATTYDIYRIDAPSVKGGSGILTLGATVIPTADDNLKLSLNANGSTGKREGVGGSLHLSYQF